MNGFVEVAHDLIEVCLAQIAIDSNRCDLSQEERDSSSMGENLADFSKLPSVVWMNILSLLNPEDQVCLLTTCSRMYALGHLRSLWEDVKLKFSLLSSETSGALNSSSGTPIMTLPSYQKRMIRFFGHMFRHITISFNSRHPATMKDEDEKILLHLAKVWKARSLRLIVFDNDDEIVPLPVAVLLNCVRLKKLELVIWPHSYLLDWISSDYAECYLSEDTAEAWNLFLCCFERSKMQHDLHSLKLTLSSDSASRAHCILKHCSLILPTLFPNLQHLQVPIEHLYKMVPLLISQEFAQLRSLDVYLVNNLDLKTTEVSETLWKRLFTVAPKLKIVCTVVSPHAEENLGTLPVYLPLVAITISQTSLPTFKNYLKVFQAAPRFSQSLKLFSCLDRGIGKSQDIKECDESLLSMVTACHKLEHLTYLCPVDGSVIITLASFDRNWKTFQFVEENIQIETRFHNALEFQTNTAQREEKMRSLCQKVSTKLGRVWKPLTDDSNVTVPSLSLAAADLVAKCKSQFSS